MQTGIGWCGSVDNRRRVRKIVSHQFLFLRLCKMSTRKGRNDSQRNGLCTDPLPCCVCLLPLPPHRSQAFLPPLWARDLTVRAGAITSADERGADPEAESRWSPALGEGLKYGFLEHDPHCDYHFSVCLVLLQEVQKNWQ